MGPLIALFCTAGEVCTGFLSRSGSFCVLSNLCIIVKTTNCRWKEVKFLAFYYFNILDSDDAEENVDNLKYDAFFSHRSETLLSLPW